MAANSMTHSECGNHMKWVNYDAWFCRTCEVEVQEDHRRLFASRTGLDAAEHYLLLAEEGALEARVS